MKRRYGAHRYSEIKYISPAWAAVTLSILSMFIAVVVWVHTSDTSRIDANTAKIERLATQVAALVQSEQDLVSMVNNYLRAKGGIP